MIEDFAEFLEIPFATSACGVYLLLRKGKVVYAGKSLNVMARIAQHFNAQVRARRAKRTLYADKLTPFVEFDKIFVRPVRRDLLDAEEIALIQKYLPQSNTLLKRIPIKVNIMTLAGFMKLKAEKESPIQVRRRRVI